MSFNENYDKIFLISGAVLGVACIGFGVMSYTGLDEKYNITAKIKDKPVEVSGIASTEVLEKKIEGDHKIGIPRNGQQDFTMFVGPNLWQQKGKTEPVDITESAPIHPPIPNAWFIENGLRDALKFSNALTLDPDNDGFTVLEEYNAKTDPMDADSHPLLVTKLVLTSVKNRAYAIAFTSDYPPEYTFKAMSTHGANIWTQTVKVGDKLGKEATDLDRFVLKEVVQKEFEVAGIKENELVAVLEDQKPSKKGATYEIRKGTRYPKTILDSTACFTITAGKQAGEEFFVEDGVSFKIPGDDKTEYTLKAIDNKAGTATVTLTEGGKERTWKIGK